MENFIYPSNVKNFTNIKLMDQLWVSLHERQMFFGLIQEMPETLTEKLENNKDINFTSLTGFYNYLMDGIAQLLSTVFFIDPDYDWSDYKPEDFPFGSTLPFRLTISKLIERLGNPHNTFIRRAINSPYNWEDRDDPNYIAGTGSGPAGGRKMAANDIIGPWTYYDFIDTFKLMSKALIGVSGAYTPPNFTQRREIFINPQNSPVFQSCSESAQDMCERYDTILQNLNYSDDNPSWQNGVLSNVGSSFRRESMTFSRPPTSFRPNQDYEHFSNLRQTSELKITPTFNDEEFSMEYGLEAKALFRTSVNLPSQDWQIVDEKLWEADYGIIDGEFILRNYDELGNYSGCPTIENNTCSYIPELNIGDSSFTAWVRYGPADRLFEPGSGSHATPRSIFPIIKPQFTYQ